MKTNPNEPLNCNNGNGFWNNEFNHTKPGVGLTKREYFAASAMQGILAHDYDSPALKIAENAVECADALIAELNKDESTKIEGVE